MTIKPYTGEFFILSIIAPNGGSVPIAVGTDQVEMLELSISLAKKYEGKLRGFILAKEGNQLGFLEEAMREQRNTEKAARVN